MELCIRQFGRAATRRELERGGRAVYRYVAPDSVQTGWRARVFGAPLGLDYYSMDSLPPAAAQQLVREQPFYALVR